MAGEESGQVVGRWRSTTAQRGEPELHRVLTAHALPQAYHDVSTRLGCAVSRSAGMRRRERDRRPTPSYQPLRK